MKVFVPYYIPGLMLIPIPEAGCIAGYIDIAFHAAFLYVLGSLVYVIDSFFQANHLLGIAASIPSPSGGMATNSSSVITGFSNSNSTSNSTSTMPKSIQTDDTSSGDDDAGGPTNPGNYLNVHT